MEVFFLNVFIILICFNIINNYILIPFDISIVNAHKKKDIANDILSLKYCEEPYINLTLGDPQQTIKMLLYLNQFEIIIKDSDYNSKLSNTFKIHRIDDEKYICNETFNFFTLNSSKELNEFIHKDKKDKEIIQKNNIKVYQNVKFVHLNISNNIYLEDEMLQDDLDKLILFNYGILGLRLKNTNTNLKPLFVKGLKEINGINASIFTFLFNKENNDDHYGYLLIGDKYIDTEKEFEETNKTIFGMRDGTLTWDLRTETIYSRAKDYSKDVSLFKEKNINVELYFEKSYCLGDHNYKDFIDTIFFNDLVEKKVCNYQKMLVDEAFGTYVCDSKSKIFLDYYNNKFPDLVFQNERIGNELILTKKDLFFYNNYNKSDTKIYFMIYFSIASPRKWKLGRQFLEKYRLSFDMDKSEIMYHKKLFTEEDQEKKNNENNNNGNNSFSIVIKVIIIIVLIIIIFFLGFLFHKLITKMPRKKKANELEEDFDYDEKNDNLDKENIGINNNE